MINKTAFFFMMFMVLLGCKKEENLLTFNDQFWVRNGKVDIPVLVEGNKTSNIFIIYIHGGPEDGAIAESGDHQFWGRLEEKYTVVYYDQRAIGMSNGNLSNQNITIEDDVDDLNKIITVLKNKYGEKSFFLLGGSWGGFVGTAYLTSKDYQKNIKGWIEIGGGHNLSLVKTTMPAQIIAVAQKQISKGKSIDKWEKFMEYASKYDTTDNSFENWFDLNQHAELLRDQLIEDGEIILIDRKFDFPKAINGITIELNNNINPIGITLFKKYYQTSYSNLLSKVTIPSRFFWGEYDFASPPALAFDAYNNIGTDSSKKKVHIFKNADHSILLSKPEELLNEIFEFVDLYK